MMGLWSKWFGCPTVPGKALDAALQRRLAALPVRVQAGDIPLAQQPLLVLDLETNGLDTRRDRVLSIGAVRIEDGCIPLGRSFERILCVEASLRPDSQLIHGLTQADLAEGSAPAEAVLDLLEYGADAIWLAYHAEFDRRMLARCVRENLGLELRHVPYDVAELAPMLCPDLAVPGAGLDHWIDVFDLPMPARHHAVADAMVTAEIMLVLLQRARMQGLRTWHELDAALVQWRGRRRGDRALVC
ncbi:MAG: 3'-5' exonuclease [Corticimicrobacter sp.]|uniref:3'-5' exonuclease n=1 Tax=Corticimicrobacter sp. TaxID=2678536 RepID=UPI0032DB4090